MQQTEAESPRGRITLLQSVAEGRIQADLSVQQAIDHCLSCRACEAVCPAEVRYGQLFDSGQAMLAERAPKRLRPLRRRQSLLTQARPRRMLLRLVWLMQRSGLARLVTRMLPRGRLRRAWSRLPQVPWPRALPSPAGDETAPRVQIFAGCLADSADGTALLATRRLLVAAGYRVEVPKTQGCCGALAAHGGDAAHAERLLAGNQTAFDDGPGTPVVALASGCAAMLQDARDRHNDHPWLERLASLWQLLADAPRSLALQPHKDRTALWVACTQRHMLRDDDIMKDVLAQASGAVIPVLRSPFRCCGAAGTHFLDRAAVADTLAEPIVAAVRDSGTRTLLCANVGCRLHLAALLREAGLDVCVQHPAEWLAARLGPGDADARGTSGDS